MSIEKEIRKYIKLANDERSRRIMMKKTNPSNTNADLTTFEAEYRQIASWLQELKERREKESRCEEVIRDPDEPYAGGDITPREVYESVSRLTEKVIEILPDLISSAIENMPEAIEQYIESKIRNGKEESK